MKKFGYLLLIVVTCCLLAAGEDPLEEQLRTQYLPSTQIIRNFYTSGFLKFDGDGKLVSKSETGSWTVYGLVVLDRLILKPNKLEVIGHRNVLWRDMKDGEMKRLDWHEAVNIEIATSPGPDQPEQLRVALRKVFVGAEDIATVYPDYWLRYVAASAGKQPPPGTCGTAAGKGTPSDKPSSIEVKAAVPHEIPKVAEIALGGLVKRREPAYPPFAKAARLGGTTVLRAVIGKSGEISNLCIVHAAGAGLDDEAVRAVKQWRYEPYRLGGEPVEVETEIKVDFCAVGCH